MDITAMTPEQLRALIQQASSALEQLARDEQEADAQTRAGLTQARDQLDALIGPETGPPGTDTIRGVQRYDDATIAANLTVAVRLLLAGLEVVALAARDVADLASRE